MSGMINNFPFVTRWLRSGGKVHGAGWTFLFNRIFRVLFYFCTSSSSLASSKGLISTSSFTSTLFWFSKTYLWYNSILWSSSLVWKSTTSWLRPLSYQQVTTQGHLPRFWNISSGCFGPPLLKSRQTPKTLPATSPAKRMIVPMKLATDKAITRARKVQMQTSRKTSYPNLIRRLAKGDRTRSVSRLQLRASLFLSKRARSVRTAMRPREHRATMV